MEKIEHWKCNSCLNPLTYFLNNRLMHIPFLEMVRSNKDLMHTEGQIHEDILMNEEKKKDRFCFKCVLTNKIDLNKIAYYYF